MEVSQIPRVFMFRDNPLPDPDHSWPPSRVLEHYAPEFPELMNATVDGGDYNDGKMVFKVKTVMGTKG